MVVEATDEVIKGAEKMQQIVDEAVKTSEEELKSHRAFMADIEVNTECSTNQLNSSSSGSVESKPVEGKVEESKVASSVHVDPQPVERRCLRCIEFVDKIDRLTLSNRSLSYDLSKLQSANDFYRDNEKKFQAKITSFQKDILELKRMVGEKDSMMKAIIVELDKKRQEVNEKSIDHLKAVEEVMRLNVLIDKLKSSTEVLMILLST